MSEPLSGTDEAVAGVNGMAQAFLTKELKAMAPELTVRNVMVHKLGEDVTFVFELGTVKTYEKSWTESELMSDTDPVIVILKRELVKAVKDFRGGS